MEKLIYLSTSPFWFTNTMSRVGEGGVGGGFVFKGYQGVCENLCLETPYTFLKDGGRILVWVDQINQTGPESLCNCLCTYSPH